MATPGLDADTPLHLLAPERATRRLLLRQLKNAEAAGHRLAIGEDTDALHDFRVALRRFRSVERAHRDWVADALPKKLRKRLRELVQSTGPARDSEVQLGWLDLQRVALRPNQRSGYQWLRRRLEDRQRQGYAAIRAAVPLEFAALGALLRAALTMPSEATPISFAQVTGERLGPLVAEIDGSFAAIGEDAEKMAHVHAARLLVKRARYLLEPVVPALPDGKELARQLGGLQNLLGEMHDAEVLGASLSEVAAEAGAARYRALIRQALGDDAVEFGPVARQRGDERAGLSALARRVREQMRAGRAQLLEKLRNGEVAALMRRLDAAADELAPPRVAHLFPPMRTSA
ncbi:MAG: CHAD domain-containing protein [Nevskiales bacterium]